MRRTADTLAWIGRLLTSMRTWWSCKKQKKISPRVSNPLPLWAQEEASPVNGVQASNDKCCTKSATGLSLGLGREAGWY